MANENPKTTDIPLSFIMGLLIGSALVALFTPKKGEDFRQDVKNQIDRVKKHKQDTEIASNEQPVIDDDTPLL